MFTYDRGIRLSGSELWLDAEHKVDFSYVSHGHADHLKSHNRIIATAPTARFFQQRQRQVQVQEVAYRQPFELDGFTIELYPSGHILGSSMILIERNGVSLLYTGDFKLRESATAESIQIPQADILIMECTFGKSEYRFLDRDTLIAGLVHFVEETLLWGAVPAVLAYSLGKGQEAMKLLGDHGFRVKAWPAMWELALIYREFGIEFRNCEPWDYGSLRGEVLVIPPQALRYRSVGSIPRLRTLLLSGWAADPAAKYRYGADEALPFSDHADFDELIEFVRKVRPKQVFTTHGFSEFPVYLRAEGFAAQELGSGEQQLSLL
ncbi:MAG: MBL fold metallo-hydrolase RNA specificity domain-containing protein [bacterium]|nr:MBL fold metallo-hydrolase [candidate division KSB1 bacterium]MDH7558930.1 MBL fold metallo-hydrolase RNA specificity domain-containing protein [bacterium]